MFLSETLTPEQLDAKALDLYIKDLTDQLENKTQSGINIDLPRPASPPPQYDKEGKRTNTRQQRIQHELEVERTLAVYKAFETIPNYAPPPFTRVARLIKKFYLPVQTYPEINFVGLLLGPRGQELKRLETESGARISIRGRGSIKESGQEQNDETEGLHCVVSSASIECVSKAFALIQQIVDMVIETPEHKNDMKRQQLRKLAELNGTLRDYESQFCTICGTHGHMALNCKTQSAGDMESEIPKISGSDNINIDVELSDNRKTNKAAVEFTTENGLENFTEKNKNESTNENVESVPLPESEISHVSNEEPEVNVLAPPPPPGIDIDHDKTSVHLLGLDSSVSLPPPPGLDMEPQELLFNTTLPPPPGLDLAPPGLETPVIEPPNLPPPGLDLD